MINAEVTLFHLIGDCHLGRTFKTGVPLNRRGEIEETFFNTFSEELHNPKGKIVIQLGDLFDSPVVPNNVLYRTYSIIDSAIRANPDIAYVFLAGNHDLPRDDKVVPAIQILKLLLRGARNVDFVIDTPLKLSDYDALILPWSYTKSVEDQLQGREKTKYVFGHFEEPVAPVIANCQDVAFVSGHIHKPHVNGNVTYVGSLLPIAFGEEPNDEIMKTMTLEELRQTPSESLENMRVRVILKEGETLPEDINCLQLIGKKEGAEEDGVQLEVNLEDFDFKELFMNELKESGKGVELWAKYLNLKNNQ